MQRFRLYAVVLAGAVIGLPVNSRSELAVYPAPGSLSNVEHLYKSSRYAVEVDGRSCFVYETDDYWPGSPSTRPDSASFACFSFRNQSVTVKVTCNFTVRSVLIRPKSDNVSFTRSGNTITFTLSQPKKLCVEVNDRKRPLFILADEPETPDTSARHYFGPGVHDIGPEYPIAANQRVYIAGGAVVEGTLLLKGDNIKVRGRGILSAGQWTAEQAENILRNTGYYDAHEYSGIVLLNSPGANLGRVGRNLVVRNVKIICWLGLTDGPHPEGGLMEDCFLFNNDDTLASSWGSHTVIRKCVVWKGPYGRPITTLNGGTANQTDCLFEDIDIIGDEGIVQERSAMIASYRIHGDGARGYKKNFTFRNIRIEEPRVAPLLFLHADGYLIENFTFENISAEGQESWEGIVRTSNGGTINGLHFKSLSLGGKTISSLAAAHIQSSGTIRNVTFEGGGVPAAPSALTAQARAGGEVRLAWRDNSADEAGFKIDRRQSGTDAWVRIATPGADATTHTDTGLAPETRFYYKVKAYNAAGNSPYSEVADVTTTPLPPAAPANLAARAAGSTRIELSWADRSSNETGFKIDRRQSGTDPWVRITTTGANATTCSDTGLRPDTRFYYLVKATNAGGDSDYAERADARTCDGIGTGAVWRYRKGTAEASEPPAAWRQPEFDDAGWAEGPGPIGYSDYAAGLGTELPDMQGSYTCVFLRRAFTVAEPAAVGELQLTADYDDGFVMWINAAEVARVNVPGGIGSAVPCKATATDNQQASWTASLNSAEMPDLRRGQNVIAVQLFNRSLSGSGDCFFDGSLSVMRYAFSEAEDADQDGMPDSWAGVYLSDLSDPADRSESADPDADGLSNLAEYIAGTDPVGSEDTFRAGVKLVTGQVVVAFPTVPATGTGYEGLVRHYSLQHRLPNHEAQWLPVTGYADLVGEGQLVRYRPETDGGPRLYRVRVWLE
ncbi:MAG: fibronectin type III domain-containing protein [Kiritimatiellae bacterium]|nr:fibronectin type III domain-containing protein [Kiritimatiellia bacterium]